MNVNKKKVPKRRFKEFQNAGAWEQRKLGDLGYFYYGKSAPKWSVTKDAKTPCVRYGELYTKHSEKIDKIYSYTNIPTDYLKFSTGNEVLVPRVGEDPLDFANCAWLSIPGVAIGEMISVYNTEQNPLFTSYMFNSKLKYEFAKRVEGGNVSNLYYVYLENILISFPTLAEQEKIASFLNELTKLITLHQRKLEKLKSLKKAYLTDMFPAEGENKPKLRFSGFTDDWEQRKLGEVAEIIGGGTPSTTNDEYWDGDIDWYAPAEINDQIYVDGSERKITELGLQRSSAKILPAEKTVLFTSRAGIGKMAILRRPGATNQGFQSMVLNDNINPYFVYSMGYMIKESAEKVASGSTFAEISGKMLSNLKFMFPDKEEQDKIGEYFHSLDNLIALHQRKLEKLQNIKKAYLNEMFV